jgi:mannosyltransferase OCH1-like enzyme
MNMTFTKKKCIIPLNIFQTWHTRDLGPVMSECVNSITECNPEFKHYIYSDDDCRLFIKNNFGADVLQAYDTLIPGAFKADLWRYCILYKLGGIYLDIKYQSINGFKFINFIDFEHFVEDRFEVLNEFAVYNAFMISGKGNEKLLKCINRIVKNVSIRYYGYSALCVTGPILMGKFFDKSDTVGLKLNNYDQIVYNSKPILMSHQGYRDEQKKKQLANHYGWLWEQKKIYKEDV